MLTLVPLTWSVARSVARGDVGVDAIALRRDGRCPGARRVPCGRGHRIDAQRRQRARGGRGAAGPARAHRAAPARRRASPTAAVAEGWRRSRWRKSRSATGSSCARARSCRSTARCRAKRGGRRVDAHRRAAAGHRARAARRSRSGTRQRRRCVRPARHPPAPRAPTPASCGSCATPSTSARRSCAWPIATQRSSCRSPWLVAGAAWAVSGDPVRALAVLVVATPCPLILAAPVALISGVSRAARAGVIAKGGGDDREAWPRPHRSLRQDRDPDPRSPVIEAVTKRRRHAARGAAEARRLVDQLSAHVLAEALVHGAEARGIELTFPEDVSRSPARGSRAGDGQRVAVGSGEWLRRRGYSGATTMRRPVEDSDEPGWARVLIGVDGRLAGAVLMADRLRDDAAELDRCAAGSGNRAHRPGHGRPTGHRRGRRQIGWSRPGLRRVLARGEDRRRARGAGQLGCRHSGDGRRRCQ